MGRGEKIGREEKEDEKGRREEYSIRYDNV